MKRVKKTYKIIVLLILTLLTINVKANNQDAITRSCIDSPSNNQSVGNTMVIQGWVMSKTANTEVKVYIDNQEEEIDRVVPRWENNTTVANTIGGITTEEIKQILTRMFLK